MVIGVAGKYSSGKDQVVAFISRMTDSKILDVDALGHEALQERKSALREAFGSGIFDEKGNINRKALGNLVFRDAVKLRRLEEIVHPLMREKAKSYIAEHRSSTVIINAALLFYMGLDRLCDTAVWVRASLLKRIRRARKRDGLTLCEALIRFRSQKKLRHKQISNNTDIYTIRNNGSIEELRDKVAEFLNMKGII